MIYREKIKRFVGDVPFAEKWFGPGGTYTAVLLLGLIVSVFSIMYMFGALQALLKGMLGPIFFSAQQ